MTSIQNRPVPTDQVHDCNWRDDFLRQIRSVPEFEGWVACSLDSTATAGMTVNMRSLGKAAEELVRRRDRGELTAARQHYNNAHLLGYWRELNEELQVAIQYGSVDPGFPLLMMHRVGSENVSTLTGFSFQTFERFNFDVLDERTLLPSRQDIENKILPVLLRPSGPTLLRQASLNRLFLQLSLLLRIQFEAITGYYKLFLRRQFECRSSLWDYYQIHYFLDRFLYVRSDGHVRRSHFEHIFGNSSVYELKVFLQYCLDQNQPAELSDVEAFLARQRRHMLHLALTISLEENEVHNCRKDLLSYDPEQGVVAASGVTGQMLEFYRQSVVSAYGLIKQDGCPFARSKGVSKNALMEEFEHFDKLMVGLLGKSKYFRQAFG